MASPSKRRELDVMKLMSACNQMRRAMVWRPPPSCPTDRPAGWAAVSDYKVDLVEDNISEMNVEFHGPKDSESAQPGSHRNRAASAAAGARPNTLSGPHWVRGAAVCGHLLCSRRGTPEGAQFASAERLQAAPHLSARRVRPPPAPAPPRLFQASP